MVSRTLNALTIMLTVTIRLAQKRMDIFFSAQSLFGRPPRYSARGLPLNMSNSFVTNLLHLLTLMKMVHINETRHKMQIKFGRKAIS